MGIPKVSKDRERLLADAEALQAELQKVYPLAARFRQDTENAVAVMIHEAVLQLLGQIPVEELNREKRGIRTKTLRDCGFETVQDLAEASMTELAEIDGISDEGAFTIKSITAELTAQAKDSIKIRISADDRSPSATDLLRALTGVMGIREPAEKSMALLDRYASAIPAAGAALNPARSGIRWLFASKAQKLAAHEGYRQLYELMTGEFGTSGRKVTAEARRLEEIPGEAAWSRFQSDPIPYFNTLEELCPGVLGQDDQLGGLPEALAAEIREEPMYLEGLRCQLRHYQEWGVKYILHQKRVLLGDEMGLGKTVQAIAAMVSMRNCGSTHFLVVSPASVLENWYREIRRHSDLPALKIHGDRRREALAQWLASGGVAVTTYETTGIIDLPEGFRLPALVVDEAHYVKNPDAQRTRNVTELANCADRVLYMTGTALENRVEEMVSLISVLQPEVADAVRGMMSLSAAPRFRELVAPVYYRRKREDVLTELPDLIETRAWCGLEPEEEKIYEAAVLGRHFTAARRVSWNAPDLAGSSKARRLLELAEEAREEGRKVIVFSFFLDTVRAVTRLLPDRCVEPISGSVSPQHRQEIVDQFTAAPAGAVLAAQIQAGGTGLNIQAASVVILCEPQLKPSIENQAISRAYRMGQTRNVLVYRLLCQDTVDERITELLEQKQEEFNAFADESAVAEESFQLDQSGIRQMMEAEENRIRLKNNIPAPGPAADENLSATP